MDFQDLHAFFHVARQESFSRAAAQLRLAQSALSRRVLRLEHQLGTKLLQRHARGVGLTDAGALLFARAEDLMRDLARIESDIHTLSSDPAGHIRIAFPPTSGQVLAPFLVAECRQRLPRVTLHIREGFSGAIHEWLVDGQVDLAVLYDPEPRADLAITPLLREPLFLIAPPARLCPDFVVPAKGIAFRRLAELPLVLPGRSHSIRALVERQAAEHGFTPHVVSEVDGINVTKGMVEAGLGFTVFSHVGVHEEVAAGTLRAIPFARRLDWRLSVAHRKSAPLSPAIAELKRMIAAQIGAMIEKKLWRGEIVRR